MVMWKMAESCWLRLEYIRELLCSPDRLAKSDGYDLLLELWFLHSADMDFVVEVGSMVAGNQDLIPELLKRIRALACSTEEKAATIRRIRLTLSDEPLKVFISYSHKDEDFKDELTTMLAGLQRQGVIDGWHDREIRPGSGWLAEIKQAMGECELAVLLVSPDFIASRFIQEVELREFFERRIEDGLRVMPIIIRPCLWQSEPVIKDLQLLPKNAKPVVTFSKENGDRDQVWADIGMEIECFAKGS